MNSKISLILRILAIVLAGGAVGLWFLIKGEIDNANLKLKPLQSIAATSEEPQKYTDKAKPVDLKGALEIVAPVVKEVNYRREKNREDDATMARQVKTIADRDRTIAQLQADIEDKDKEIAQLSRDKSDLESRLAEAEAKASSLESEVKQGKAEVAALAERIAGMKTMEEFNEKLEEIAGLEKQMESGDRRYTRLRNYARSKGVALDNNDFPSALYAKAGYSAIEVKFEEKYIVAKVQTIDTVRGLMTINVGTLERNIFSNGQYDVVYCGKSVGQIQITQCDQTKSLACILHGSKLEAVPAGAEIKLVPFAAKF